MLDRERARHARFDTWVSVTLFGRVGPPHDHLDDDERRDAAEDRDDGT
jgi:hypothetical protein